MLSNILLPLSLFIIIQLYIFSLNIELTEKIIADDNNKISNYTSLMLKHSDITVLMIILITFYSLFGRLFILF